MMNAVLIGECRTGKASMSAELVAKCVWLAAKWLNLCLLFSGMLAAEEQSPSEEVMKAIKIELDAFSGLPNPTWILRGEHAEKAVDLFKNLNASDSKRPLYDGLGYRGLRITGLLDKAEVTVWNGIVQANMRGRALRWHEKDRQLERYLLATAKSYLKDPHALNVIDSIVRDFGR